MAAVPREWRSRSGGGSPLSVFEQDRACCRSVPSRRCLPGEPRRDHPLRTSYRRPRASVTHARISRACIGIHVRRIADPTRHREHPRKFTNANLTNGWKGTFGRGRRIRTFPTCVGARTNSHAPMVFPIHLTRARRKGPNLIVFGQSGDLQSTFTAEHTQVACSDLYRPKIVALIWGDRRKSSA